MFVFPAMAIVLAAHIEVEGATIYLLGESGRLQQVFTVDERSGAHEARRLAVGSARSHIAQSDYPILDLVSISSAT